MKRHERLGCLVAVLILLAFAWVAVYWGLFALDNLREILERVG